MTWQCGTFSFECSPAHPLIMGVCNVTPDSFSDGGQFFTAATAIKHAKELIEQGADIIDVGGESTRPGSVEVSPKEEVARILPVVKELAACGIAVSVDTRHAQVAKACVEAGACIINDVSGFRDEKMQEALAESNAGAVTMHMQGKPKTMQEAPNYSDVVADVEKELLQNASLLELHSVSKERICIDPGIGFGKSQKHNRALLQASSRFAKHGYPLMVAVSRKSYIGQVSGIEKPSGRDEASALCAAYICRSGASIIRTHNVELTKQVLKNSKRAFIALGSNMGDAQANLDEALAFLGKTTGIWVGAISSYVQSEPAYYIEQQNFVNAVCVIQTMLTPHELLDVLHVIENNMGRKREIPNGPRCIDLDILDFESCVMNGAELILPHPRILEREFVVKPLLEICPNYVLADKTPVALKENAVGKVSAILREAC